MDTPYEQRTAETRFGSGQRGAEMKRLNGFSLAATFEGELSSNLTSYAGKGVARYTGEIGFPERGSTPTALPPLRLGFETAVDMRQIVATI